MCVWIVLVSKVQLQAFVSPGSGEFVIKLLPWFIQLQTRNFQGLFKDNLQFSRTKISSINRHSLTLFWIPIIGYLHLQCLWSYLHYFLLLQLWLITLFYTTSQICGIFRDKITEKSADLAGISRQFSWKAIGKKTADFVVIFRTNFARNWSVFALIRPAFLMFF